MNPAIVVLAYNRPTALRRLLDSIARGAYPGGGVVPLVVSIDAGGDPDVARMAEAFPWPHGDKKVVLAETHLGLVGHFHRAGALAEAYGSIILLEDDLVVSPGYYRYAAGALAFYRDDDRIAGVSLYALWFNGYNHLPFVPILDDSDVFFLQIPFYVGQAFTASQWARYRVWRAEGDPRPTLRDPLHPLLAGFGPNEWFPERIKYLAATGRYFVYPRESLSTGFGDVGTHFTRPSSWFQAPIQGSGKPCRFVAWDESVAVYDSFFEILPDRLGRLVPDLPGAFDVDLYGSKPPRALPHERVLTSRRSRAPLESWGRVMWPAEANLAHRVRGDEIVLSPVGELRWGWWEDIRVQKVLHHYFSRGRALPWRLRFLFALLNRWGRFGARWSA